MKYLFILFVIVSISGCAGDSALAEENENLKEQLVQAQQQAEEAKLMAEKAAEMAREAEANAHRQAELAQKALEECEGKN